MRCELRVVTMMKGKKGREKKRREGKGKGEKKRREKKECFECE